jgi:hypothetical protein
MKHSPFPTLRSAVSRPPAPLTAAVRAAAAKRAGTFQP